MSGKVTEGYCWAISSAVAPASKAATTVSRVTRVPPTRIAPVSVGLNRNPLEWNVQFHEASVGGPERAVNLSVFEPSCASERSWSTGFQRPDTCLSSSWSTPHTAEL